MSVKITVSYQKDKEREMIMDRLEDLALSVSNKEYPSGEYRRIYLSSKKELSTIHPQDE